ncbi:MAG: hypothetical protein CME19_10715 [Gemmatimonadetes bacterium]|nr:hypothetical protein [Gemmatimonadota bacterium]
MRDLFHDSTHLNVDDKVQTFVDNLLLESVTDVTRRWHTPERVGDGPVLAKTEDYEGLPYFGCANYTVIRDARDGLFKCWYEIMVGEPDPQQMGLGMHSRMCYAVSENGFDWEKPSVGLEADGRKTNIVLGDLKSGAHGLTVLEDPNASSEDERFKGLFTRMWDGNKNRQIVAAHSPDGIRWEAYDDLPCVGSDGPRLCDVHIVAVDPYSHEYVAYTRHFLMTAGATRTRFDRNETFSRPYEPGNTASYSQRRIWKISSADFIHWSEPVLLAASDEDEDNLDDSFYGMVPYRVGSQHIAPLCVFRAVDNEMDVQLLHSRDGLRWRRGIGRRPFLDCRGEGHWDAHMVTIVNPPIEIDDELLFFHSGTDFHHDWWLVGQREGIDHPEALDPLGCGAAFGMGVARLRKDGYAGMFANQYRKGIVTTHAMISLGSKLSINAACGEPGSIHVEVLNRDDQVIGSCEEARCDAFTGDATDHIVTWEGDPTVPAGRGQDQYWRKLRFTLRNAELFSFRFTDSAEDPTPFKTEKEW